MVSGNGPFHRGSSADTIAAILKEEPPPLSESVAAVAPEVSKTIERCLEKQPEDRFQSASDLAYNLRTISSASGPLVGRSAARFAGWRKSVLWLFSSLVVAAIAVVWWNPGDWRGRLLAPGGSVDRFLIDILY